MNDIWMQFKTLFQDVETYAPSQPFMHAPMRRVETEMADYADWKQSQLPQKMAQWLYDEYLQHKKSKRYPSDLTDFVFTSSLQSFTIHHAFTAFEDRDTSYFFHWLAETLISYRYEMMVSDARAFTRPEWVEHLMRYQLQCSFPFTTDIPLHHQLTQINIDFMLIDDKPSYIRFNSELDRKIAKTEKHPFEAMLEMFTQETM